MFRPPSGEQPCLNTKPQQAAIIGALSPSVICAAGNPARVPPSICSGSRSRSRAGVCAMGSIHRLLHAGEDMGGLRQRAYRSVDYGQKDEYQE